MMTPEREQQVIALIGRVAELERKLDAINNHDPLALKELKFKHSQSEKVDVIRDEDDMASDDEDALSTQQSIKAWGDNTFIKHSLADAANDFLVASAADTFVKKTLAETGAILEGDIDHGNLQGLSTGADHSYIDQDVTTTGTPEFGITTLADGSTLKTSAAPTTDAQIANKKYVDDNAGGGANVCYMETGSYTGDGTTSQEVSLSDSSLVVKAVWIYTRITAHVTRGNEFFTTDEMIDDNAAGMAVVNYYGSSGAGYSAYHLTNRVIALGTGSFTVDDAESDAVPNQNGVVYNYLVIGTH